MATAQVAGPNEGLRKRHQIQSAGKMMFVWVAIASLVVGVSAVGIYLLAHKIHFGNQVIAEKIHTRSVLKNNLDTSDQLIEAVQVLNTNTDLRENRISDSQNPVEVVLDALPAEANSSALAASLQKRLLGGDGISLEMLSVDPVADEIGEGSDLVLNEDVVFEAVGDVQQIPFSFEVSARDPAALKKMLQRLERSIRIVDLFNLELESEGSQLRLTGQGLSFYQPKVTTIMKEVTVPKQ